MIAIRSNDRAYEAAGRVLRSCRTNDPDEIAGCLGIIVYPRAFTRQKGVYKVILRNRYIFIKDDLSPEMHKIVLCHEIGHDRLHRTEANALGMLKEFDIFDMQSRTMEYEANIFAAEILIPDGDILDCIYSGKNIRETAACLGTDENLVALKASELNRRGYNFREQGFCGAFLK